MQLARITVHNHHCTLEKVGGLYIRTTQAGPGARKVRSEVSELKAAELCSFSDWLVHESLREAKASRFPYQAILAELIDL